MIPRYTRPEMGSIWTDQNKFQKWLEVEIATAEVEAEAISLLRAFRDRRGFILSSGCEIPPEARPENVAAMAKAPSANW